jgi:chaperonin GroES
MKIRPLQDRLLLRPVEAEAKTAGGIIIPDTAKEKPQEGEVVAAGKGRIRDDGKLVPLDVKTGDRVLYGKYSGSEITLDGETYVIVREEDVLAILG